MAASSELMLLYRINYRVNTVKISRLQNLLFILIIFAFLLSLTKKNPKQTRKSANAERDSIHFWLTHITRSGIAFDINLKTN